MENTGLSSILSLSVSPVVLISGVGLLLLSITNRLGRVVDRTRALAHQARGADEDMKGRIQKQMKLLYRRAEVLRLSILAGSLSILLVSCMILCLFLTFVFTTDFRPIVMILFAGCIVSLIVSISLFTKDVTLSLRALSMEISDTI